MRSFERLLGEVATEPEHEPVADDPTTHVPVEHEGETPEHRALTQSGVAGQDVADARCEHFVVGHECTFLSTAMAMERNRARTDAAWTDNVL